MPNDQARIYASICRGVLLQAAIKAKGQFIGWTQYAIGHQSAYNEWLKKGQCQGFSIKFLHCCKNNLSFENEVTNRLQTESSHGNNALLSELLLASQAGNAEFDSSPHERHVFMHNKYALRFLDTQKFEHGFFPWLHQRLATFCEKNNVSTLIYTNTHAMAVANYNGLYQFFEPNAGIVIMHSNKLSSLFSCYFEHPFIKQLYAGNKNINFSASRYV